MSNSKPEKKKGVELMVNPALPVLAVDNLVLHVRSDNTCFLRFATQLPENLSEQVKIMVQRDKLEHMLDVICTNIGYFPEKPKPNKKISS